MSQIEQIEEQIKKLNPDELQEFRAWFLRFDSDGWDRQVEADSRNGRLDALAAQALQDHKDGKSTRL